LAHSCTLILLAFALQRLASDLTSYQVARISPCLNNMPQYHSAGTHQPYGLRADGQVANFMIRLTLPRYLVNAPVIHRSLLSVAGRVIMHLGWFRDQTARICEHVSTTSVTDLFSFDQHPSVPSLPQPWYASALSCRPHTKAGKSFDASTLSDSRELEMRLSFPTLPPLIRCVFDHISSILWSTNHTCCQDELLSL
jgi:hypothetical protein